MLSTGSIQDPGKCPDMTEKLLTGTLNYQLKQKEARHDQILSNMHLITNSGLRGLLYRVLVVERDPIAYKPSHTVKA